VRIAFVSTLKGTPWGGSEELWAAACARALHMGHTVLVSRYDWPEAPAKQAKLAAAGAGMSLRPLRPNKIARLFPRPRWLRELEAFGPDAICLSQGGAYECAGHRSMIPLVKWLRRSDAALVNLIQFNTPDTSLGPRAAVRAKALYERAAVNAFVAEANIHEATRRLAWPVPRAVVVRNPVNLPDTSPIPWPTGPVLRFATVARLDARTKGQDMLLDTLANPVWQARDWMLSFFGLGPDERRYRATVAADPALARRIGFHGHVDDIRAVWAAHHIHILPSRAEGTPLAMVEAMLLGRPCIVCNAGGCADWITDGVEGFIAPEPTQPHVAAAMERAWIARHRWPEMGLAASDRAARQMGPDPGGELVRILEHAADAARV
jgi:glycosyltransferase involved in cell wall biosynthesis